MMDFNRVWLPFLYLYGVGGLIFLIGMYIISQSKSLKRERKRHKKWFYVLIFGFIYYVGIHSFFRANVNFDNLYCMGIQCCCFVCAVTTSTLANEDKIHQGQDGNTFAMCHLTAIAKTRCTITYLAGAYQIGFIMRPN